MPRIKPLIREDPRRLKLRGEIGEKRSRYQLTIKELARRSGINESTLVTRIGNTGDIGSMRLSELWALEDAFHRLALERGMED